jgi:hypothetical protein
VVLFGGDVQNFGIEYNDTWTWDGTTWTQQFPLTAPTARTDASIAYDATLGLVVIFGGGYTSAPLNDTGGWNGTDWGQLHPATQPRGRYAASMSYYPLDGGLVLFGGFDPQALNDTWIFTLVP